MLQLEGTKCSFLFCLGICILLCFVIHLRTRAPAGPHAQSGPLSCRAFSTYCQTFLPSTTTDETLLQSHDCKVESEEGLLEHVSSQVLGCPQLLRDLHFITGSLSREEEDYPLAFILTVHKELALFIRLLRAIYAPHNVYCIHVDLKALPEYRAAVEHVVGCLPNAFLSSHSETVTYAGFTRLQADINCMRDLVRSPVAWRKVVNLCGQDFPIKSNLELVRYMQSKEWRDRNMTPGVKQPPAMGHRTQFHHREVKGSHVVQWGKDQKKPPPHGLEVYFGTAYYALTRPFVDYVLKNQVARDLLEWSRDTFSPDEHYWVTLNHIKGVPGSDLDGGWDGAIRAIKWKDQEGTAHFGCKGRYVRDICIYGLEDLQWVIDKNSMFANKFESGNFPVALDCLELWHRNKVLQQASVPIEPSWLLATLANSTVSTSSPSNATAGL
ncbi:beta-1,3-galactosyl-O-glycosyl-glycoprotein beta-1,6-N-acetylglucosaminyltransferase 7 isoform X2 [Hypomesus transpacificus]|nr:beta-1,3-galactosyl-O-glycosyl-glycoprotein beta-1,6-N-acetylglucosaminyltransferase 7 isoform X2 [Hypomesus transpacificus]